MDKERASGLKTALHMELTSLGAYLGREPSRDLAFHISREARSRYRFSGNLYTSSGNVIFPDFHSVRLFARRLNEKRDLARFPEIAVRAGELNAMGLIDEILHFVLSLYLQDIYPDLLSDALSYLEERVNNSDLLTTLRQFVESFPTPELFRGEYTVDDYFSGSQGERQGVQIALEEMFMLWIANRNTAFTPFRELFDESGLAQRTQYSEVADHLGTFFQTCPGFGPNNLPLHEMLQDPARAEPYSLSGQLRYIQKNWGLLLGPLTYRVFSAFDLVKEESRPLFEGPGEISLDEMRKRLKRIGAEDEERYSPDRAWMPDLILIAKSVHVWLGQLSERYKQKIERLDQIPDEELDKMAERGFTGLWLIGIWDRSSASKRIKNYCGNPDALASAYSLRAYEIAEDLGGWDALQNLKSRALDRGIRLASDMVPNHMGIDSPWLIHHPDRFLQTEQSPFPVYTFSGPDLSSEAGVSIFLEDHYYDRSDAAVVFKRVNNQTGESCYIYHGNDGTRTPWNDTAQLNYLNPETREAVAETILKVASTFPIIRFDAAMTLTKQHYQRLWFPRPGTGGDIPSRVDCAMSEESFDEAMPGEFWREVVDRVAEHAPDTLLLAEAFWLMESYFVRTLGMHRVYNSAFMNFLKMEENAKYRTYLKSVLEFDKEILKRYVNFMNNPDEETAVAQFGRGDKYFGVCTLLATLPGLPMFGHGQVEGLEEKYGMEFRRAMRDEGEDSSLVERHNWEIFPLLRRRYLFSGVDNFVLYDLERMDGSVDENVIAYSNRYGDERSLVIYHNTYASTEGWLRTSAAFRVKGQGEDGSAGLTRCSFTDGLHLRKDDGEFVTFRDTVTGLQYLKRTSELVRDGFYVNLGAYDRHVFLEFSPVHETEDQKYARLHDYLGGRGVPSIEDAIGEILKLALRQKAEGIFCREMVDDLCQAVSQPAEKKVLTDAVNKLQTRYDQLLKELSSFVEFQGDPADAFDGFKKDLRALAILVESTQSTRKRVYAPCRKTLASIRALLLEENLLPSLVVWILLRSLGRVIDPKEAGLRSATLIEEYRWEEMIRRLLGEKSGPDLDGERYYRIVKILLEKSPEGGFPDRSEGRVLALVRLLLRESDMRAFIGLHRYRGTLWFNRESFEMLMKWMTTSIILTSISSDTAGDEKDLVMIDELWEKCTWLLKRAEETGYRYSRLFRVGEDNQLSE